MPVVHVYSRRGCHLCELLIEELMPLVRGAVQLEVRDVDSSLTWRKKYGDRVPVVEIDGRFVCHYRLDQEAVAIQLREHPVPERE